MCGGDDHLAWKHPVSWRRAEGCVPPEGTIASARDPLPTHFIYRAALTLVASYRTLSSVSIFVGEFIVTSLDSPLWIRVGGRLTRVSDQLDQRSDQGIWILR
ncbi:hypothetical protein CK203_064331 [Vitis vinifera]|uniref:Uncharacterized protein n=1 Tax=Vitis vinifera TaxID=29760 RepID=A0A438G504_VITVI|nr:hypothetical protein CK203_064331 [Vitis vinifera]